MIYLIYRVYSCHVVTFSGCCHVATAAATTIRFSPPLRLIFFSLLLVLVPRSLVTVSTDARLPQLNARCNRETKAQPIFRRIALFYRNTLLRSRRLRMINTYRKIFQWLRAKSTRPTFFARLNQRESATTTRDRSVKRISRNTKRARARLFESLIDRHTSLSIWRNSSAVSEKAILRHGTWMLGVEMFRVLFMCLALRATTHLSRCFKTQ